MVVAKMEVAAKIKVTLRQCRPLQRGLSGKTQSPQNEKGGHETLPTPRTPTTRACAADAALLEGQKQHDADEGKQKGCGSTDRASR